jgi:CBS domain-containing protein
MRVQGLLGGKRTIGVVTIAASATVSEAAELMMRHRIGGLPVVRADGTLVGFVSERDIVAALHRAQDDPRGSPIEKIMRSAPTCSSHDAVRTVMERMTRERLRHLVVLDNDAVIGVISVGDLVKQRIEELETETGVLRDVVIAQRAKG